MPADQTPPPATARISQTLTTAVQKLWDADENTLRWVLGLLIVVLAGFNFVRDLDNPPHAFWDEAYYLSASQRYVEGTAQYASHPPLAFMFMDAGIKLTGVNKNVDTHQLTKLKKIDSRAVPNGYDFTGVRLPSALFAVISALLFYLICLRLSGEAFEAFVFALMFTFENSFLVHFRAGHLDSYQLTFTLASILVWLHTFGKTPKRPLLTYGLFGILCGLSFMVKVNSLPVILLGGMSLIRDLWADRTRQTLLKCLGRGSAITAGFVAMVVLIFSLHVILNPNAPDPTTAAGKKDLRYMGQIYRDYLNDKRPLSPVVIWDATKGYYAYMKYDFVGETKSEPNGSQPVLWPFMAKIINYRWDFDGKRTAYTQMVGNPVNWGLGIIGLVTAAVLIVRRRAHIQKTLNTFDMDILEAMFAMYMIFWTFHIYLGTQRVMYIYHYFIGLSLSFLMLPLIFRIIAQRVPLINRYRFGILCTFSIAIASSYLFYAPLTYHQFMTRDACELRNVPVKLVVCQPMKKPAKPLSPHQ